MIYLLCRENDNKELKNQLMDKRFTLVISVCSTNPQMNFLLGVLIFSDHTGDDEHDAGREAHLGLAGVCHAVHREAGQGEN